MMNSTLRFSTPTKQMTLYYIVGGQAHSTPPCCAGGDEEVSVLQIDPPPGCL